MLVTRTASADAILVEHVTKIFDGRVVAVDDVSLPVPPGALLALLGPRGCGKSTLLRLIAGLETPDAGSISMSGRVVADGRRWVPAEERRVGLVFQDGALFPHLTVEQNIGFGLRGQDRNAQAERIGALLDLVGLAGLEGRYPHQLSGGQQQRVALARALAPNPPVMLLDEPFANLDAALRRDLAQEVERIVHDAAAATVFVTHDQEEALSTADIVAVMQAGRIVQVGEPRVIYERPATRGVAAFVGEATFVPGDARGAQAATMLGSIALVAPQHGAVEVLVRPEQVELAASEAGNAVVVRSTYFGYDQVVDVRTDDGMQVRARLRPDVAFTIGQRVVARVAGVAVAFPV